MAKYELSDTQVKQLQNILANATIKGSEAPVIIQLAKALQTPVMEPKPEKK